MLGEGNSTDVDLAKTDPWENDGEGDDALEPESGVVFAGVRKGLAWLTIVVDKVHYQGPDQSQSCPSEETVSPLEGIVELIAQGRVGEHEHHQE